MRYQYQNCYDLYSASVERPVELFNVSLPRFVGRTVNINSFFVHMSRVFGQKFRFKGMVCKDDAYWFYDSFTS